MNRQLLDKVYVYDGMGQFYDQLPTTHDLFNHAIVKYISAHCDRNKRYPRETNDAIVGVTRSYPADAVVEAIDDCHQLLKQTSKLMAAARLIFGNNSDFVWRDRTFTATRDAQRIGLGLRSGGGGVMRGITGALAKEEPFALEFLADATLAVWCEYGIVNWQKGLVYQRDIESLAVSHHDVPFLVAESLIRKMKMLPVVRPSGQRVMFGQAYKYLEDVTLAASQRLSTIATLAHFAGRITSLCAYALRSIDSAAIPKAPFAPFLSAVNFVVPGARQIPMTPVEGSVIAPMMAEVLQALNDAPHVRTKTVREYADMFDVRRIISHRSKMPVMTLVTRRYGDERKPARVFDQVEMSELAMHSFTPSDTDSAVPNMEATLDALFRMLDTSLTDEVVGSYAEADPGRLLVSTAHEEELRTLAACLAGEVVYSTSSADPSAPTRVQFVMRPDVNISSWEDLATATIDGVAVLADWQDVLRLAPSYIGSGKYAIADGVSALLEGGSGSYVIGRSVGAKWLEGGKAYTIQVRTVNYDFTMERGMQVKGLRDPEPIEMTGLLLLGQAPMRSHSIVMPPVVRERLRDSARLFVALYDLSQLTGSNQRVPGYVHVSSPHGAQPVVFNDDQVGQARRTAVSSMISLLYMQALITFINAAPSKLAHSQAVVRSKGRAQRPIEALEAEAYLETVLSYMDRFVVELLALPTQFRDLLRSIQLDPQFSRLAMYEILHRGKEA